MNNTIKSLVVFAFSFFISGIVLYISDSEHFNLVGICVLTVCTMSVHIYNAQLDISDKLNKLKDILEDE